MRIKKKSMIDLSRAKVNKRIPKNRFKAELADVDTIMWLYKISPDTAEFRHGDEIAEIQVFAVTFKNGKVSKRDLAAIQKAIPYPILFTIYAKNYFIVDGEILESDKQFTDNDKLIIERRSAILTDLYEDIATEFIPIVRRTAESIADFVQRYKRFLALEREIETLQRKVDNEKQPNKRIELNEELKKLKSERRNLL